jgi:hypothetical protein
MKLVRKPPEGLFGVSSTMFEVVFKSMLILSRKKKKKKY